MDPHSFIARAEAQRWLGIAEKLLMGHDLVGSKTFAIRARESDPRIEGVDQILAIVDTLLAAEKRVIGDNGAQQPDFYAILQLVQFVQDTEHIASQYRRLAVLLNPHQNRFPYSDQAFDCVNEAWAVLSNPMRKSMYDGELNFPQQQHMNSIGFNLEHQHHEQQQQHNFFTINHMGSSHEPELPEPQQSFESRVQRSHQQQQLHQHNFLSQNPARSVPVREQGQLFQHHEQEQLFQPQVEPFEVTSALHQQTRPPPQPTPPPPPPAAPSQPPFSWAQAPPLPQPQQHFQPQSQPQLQIHQQQLQQEQEEEQPPPQQQRQQESSEQTAANVQLPSQAKSNNGIREEETEVEAESETEEAAQNVDDSPSFWTSCPFCFYMYEYPKAYADCTLRCDHCKRAYQAVRVSSPPSIVEGKEAYYYCWGFFPIGVSMSHLPKTKGAGTKSKWTPFSPLYVSSNVQNHSNGKAEAPKKNAFVNRTLEPRTYIDDVTDDIFTGISEPSDESDVEWNSTREKKLKRMKYG